MFSRSFHIEIRSETAVNGKEASLMKYITLEWVSHKHLFSFRFEFSCDVTRNRPILMLGTYEPSILLYDIQSDGIELVTRCQLGKNLRARHCTHEENDWLEVGQNYPPSKSIYPILQYSYIQTATKVIYVFWLGPETAMCSTSMYGTWCLPKAEIM